MNLTQAEKSKTDLLRWAAQPEGWIDDLEESTRAWAADLPMEALLAGLRPPGRQGLLHAAGFDRQQVAIRSALLALACKDPDLLDAVADEHLALVPSRGLPGAELARSSQPSLAA